MKVNVYVNQETLDVIKDSLDMFAKDLYLESVKSQDILKSRLLLKMLDDIERAIISIGNMEGVQND